MDIATLTDDEVIAEVRQLQYLFQLKREIRYAQKREEEEITESVAEHIYGMHILALYFLHFEDPEGKWDRAKIFSMITLHDIDEIETGDAIDFLRSQAMQDNEWAVKYSVKERSPRTMHAAMSVLIDEYEARQSPEAKFVRAIDKFEPLVHLYSVHGKQIQTRLRVTFDNCRSTKIEPIKPFASIQRFADVLHNRMLTEDYFCTDQAALPA